MVVVDVVANINQRFYFINEIRCRRKLLVFVEVVVEVVLVVVVVVVDVEVVALRIKMENRDFVTNEIK